MKTRLLVLSLVLSSTLHAATDGYQAWAAAKWGASTVGSPSARLSTWGESADPDQDGLPNLLEYATDTNPRVHNPSSDCSVFTIPEAGSAASRYPQLTAFIRQDDPDLRVIPQTSSDLFLWEPFSPVDFTQPQPANTVVLVQDTGLKQRGLNQMRYVDKQSMAQRSRAFMRLKIVRRNESVTTPPIEPFFFTPGQTVAAGGTARSNAIILGGFAGLVAINIPANATLYVNGVAQTGTTTTVKAGDMLWLQAAAPNTVGTLRNHTLTIGGHSATWRYTTGAAPTVPDHPGTISGYTPLETGVSDTGAAQISIPIFVSPGTGGMQPKLSVNYSSQSGNGPLGTGFSLGGLGAITRVGRTMAQDGVKGGIHFNANDRFALDGQRLIAINGTDGGSGTEYRLEFDPTSRIRSHGIEGGGPQRWVVETKAGLRMEYGLAASARTKPEGGDAVLSWAVDKITDTAGNSIIFSYDPSAALQGETLLTNIAYTSNVSAGLSAGQEVVVEYEARPDMRTVYVGGFAIRSSKRISAIESRAREAGTMKRVRRYVPVYQQAEINGCTQMIQLQEITSDGTTLPPSVFEWHETGVTSLASAISVHSNFMSWNPHFDANPPAAILTGDFNGDGLMDVAKMNEYVASRDYLDQYMMFGKTDGTFRILGSIPGLTNKTIDAGGNSQLRTGDFNADGLSDLLYIKRNGTGNWLALGTANDRFTVLEGAAIGGDSGNPGLNGLGYLLDNGSDVLTMDFTNDGRSDILVLESNGAHVLVKSLANGRFEKITNVAGLNGAQTDPSSIYATYSWIVPGDFNGDGAADILHLYHTPAKRWVALGNGDGTFTRVNATDNGGQGMLGLSTVVLPADYCHVVSGDYNGDGMTDVACIHQNLRGTNWIALSRGQGRFEKMDLTGAMSNADHSSPPVSNHTETKIIGLDFNGDGLTDLFHIDSSQLSNTWMALSRGNGTFEYHFGSALGTINGVLMSGSDWTRLLAGDFDGDGREDILNLQRIYDTSYLARGTGFDRPRIVKATNGHGGSSTFAYKHLTDSTVHTKGSGLAYPSYDIQAPLQVVSSMTARNGIDGDGLTMLPAPSIGEHTVQYRYEGAWASMDGRGFMGFKAVESTENISGIVTRTLYEDRPLYAGRAKHVEQRLATAPAGGSTLISESDTTWNLAENSHSTGRKTYLVTESSSVTRSYEINRPAASALVRAVTRSGPGAGGSITYDSYGNLLESTSSTAAASETFTEAVTNTYADSISPTKWHLGRLATSTVTKTGPNPAGSGTQSLTRTSVFSYHPTSGLLSQEVIEPSGGTLRLQKDYSHDAFGNILTSSVTTPGESTRTTGTTYTTDARFVETTTNAAGHADAKTYDSLLGNVLAQTSPNGLTITWEYDSMGRPVKETRPDGTMTRSFYRRVTASTAGAPPRAVHYVRVQSSGGPPKTVWYDLLDREIRTDTVGFDGGTVSAHKVFNHLGQVTHASQPYAAGTTPLYTTFLYDAVGREHRQTDPGNRVTQTLHNGLSTSMTNPKGQTVTTTVNTMGWTVQSTQDSNKTVYRKYDVYGNLRFVSDSSGGTGNVTELRYDMRGNKAWMSEPNSGISTYTYNGFGELKSQTNAAGETVTFTHDVLGRVTSRTELEGVTTFTYDTAAHGKGQLAREAGPGCERQYFYDSLGRPAATRETHGFHSFSTSRSYDLVGRPDILTYPTGFATQQAYTAHGHLSEVRNASSTSEVYWRALQVNARGQVAREVLGNGVVTDRSFETETGLIQDITSTFGSTGDVQKLSFGFDVIGNLTERRDRRFATHFVEGFGYDAMNRLLNVTTTGAGNVTVTYDAIGNITHRSDVGSYSYASGKPHALTTISGGTQNKICGHDTKGNRTIDGDTRLEYSSFNKPVRIRKTDDSSILGFDYGTDRGLSRQTIFQISPLKGTSQTIREYVDAYEREMTSEGMVRHIHHIGGGSGVVAIHTDERSATSQSQRTRYVHKDHLGSVDAITDDSGAVVERQSYDAWGRRRSVTHNSGTWAVSYPSKPGSAETRRGFTGHEMLDLVGLIHMGGRIYDPLTSRFLSPDPFVQSPDNLQNLNRYSYVLNNPLSFTDPSGFFFKSIGKFFKKHWKTIATIAIGVATGYGFAALAGQLGATGAVLAAAGGAGFGFGSSFSGTLLAGGSVGDALRAGLKAGAIGAATAAATFGVGQEFGLSDLKLTDTNFARKLAVKIVAHGAIQGASNELQGGKFIHGMIAGGLSGGASPYIANAQLGTLGEMTAAAVVGGTGSALGGGKFSNGAVSGAFVYLFNQVSNHLAEPDSRQHKIEEQIKQLDKRILLLQAIDVAETFTTTPQDVREAKLASVVNYLLGVEEGPSTLDYLHEAYQERRQLVKELNRLSVPKPPKTHVIKPQQPPAGRSPASMESVP